MRRWPRRATAIRSAGGTGGPLLGVFLVGIFTRFGRNASNLTGMAVGFVAVVTIALKNRILDATDPDLGDFAARGGKIISYFGWADTALNPLVAIDYRERVGTTVSRPVDDFFRLFMVPGMFHCRGGVGADHLDAMTALIDWVEAGVAPDRIVASQRDGATARRTRPVCPFPQVARFKGTGETDVAANFDCVVRDAPPR
ncbi:MAG: tannase/feruloyl esterase family alpha/beta hydrolase [Acidobacteriota bacterium]